jgi:1-acyl-sn-glycerol-3-phosphate acyltransferase
MTQPAPPSIRYPRRRLQRLICRLFARLLLPLFFRIRITGKDNFPRSGPLITVGNHVAVMEAVLMAVYSPWLIEMLGSVDIPHEKFNAWIINFFGYIPIFRGRMERRAMHQALEVLAQNGVIGVFPEGGIWDTGSMKPQTGVAWLSQKSGVPVLPIAFGGTLGALADAFKFKRPQLTMTIGKPIPPASASSGEDRRAYLEEYANQVMSAVYALLPAEQRHIQPKITHETFKLEIALHDRRGQPVEIPPDLLIHHSAALVKFLHRPAILKIFDINLHLPVKPIQNLHTHPTAAQISQSLCAILDYLANDNPYLLTYRFGPKEGEAMQLGLQELLALSAWAVQSDYTLHLTPIRRFFSAPNETQITQTRQGEFKHWM